MEKHPNVEAKLTASIRKLDDEIMNAKQDQIERIQSGKQIDRLQTKAIYEKRGGGHTDKTSTTDKNIEMGQKYQASLKEHQLIKAQIKQ